MTKAGKRRIRAVLRKAQAGACCYCRRSMVPYAGPSAPKGGWPTDMETLEHLRRKADGGTNQRDNLALACRPCNVGRGDMDWLTYASFKAGELELAA